MRTLRNLKSRKLSLESLENRELLSVSTGEFDAIRSQYADLNLSANDSAYNIIEITALQLSSDTDLRNAITKAAETTENDLIVVRTNTTQNKITLSGTELEIDIDAETSGSVHIVSLGDSVLTLDANQKSSVFNITNSAAEVGLAGLTITASSGGGISNSGTLTVTNTTISGNSANSSGGGISNSGTLTVTNTTISGNYSASSGGGISNSGTLTVTHTTISENNASSGGGIYNEYDGTLTVTNTMISGNYANFSGGGISNSGTLTVTNTTISENSAGGIYNSGTLTVTNTTISGNSAFSGGGISNSGTLTVTNTTISENNASSGGGIYNSSGTLTVTHTTISGNSAFSGGGISNSGTLTVTNTTISGNSANYGGGGILNYDTATLYNTIVAKNSSDIYSDSYYGGTLSGFNNLIGNGSGQTSLVDGNNGNLVGTAENPIDPMLGEWSEDLRTFGTPLAGSPVIDAGNNNYVSGDKDVLGNNRIQNGTVDIGAIEGVLFTSRSGVTYLVTSLEDNIAKDGVLTFREALEAANRNVAVGDAVAGSFSEKDIITFATSLSGTFQLGGTQLSILGSVDIIGSGADKLIFDADNQSRVFFIDAGIAVGLSNMTITNGWASSGSSDYDGYGGGIYNSGTLTVTNTTISGNSAYFYGGGIYNSGTLTVTNTTISGNSAGYDGGGILNGSGTLTVTNTTISGNSANSGGGISNSGTLTVTNTTISGNSANYGGGIDNSGTATLYNTIVAKNSSDIYSDSYYGGTLSGFNNLIGNGSGQTSLVDGNNGNLVGTAENPIDPMLGEWSEDLGTFGTPLAGSPVIDAGDNRYVSGTKDVLGNTRIQNGTVDIGAIEGVPFTSRSGVTYLVTSLDNNIAKDGVLTFREALEAANRNVAVGDAVAGSFSEKDIITFATGLSGTFQLGGTELSILGSVDIIGSGVDKLIFDAENKSRIFSIDAGIAVGLSNMTITNGWASSGSSDYDGSGGGIYNSGTLTVTNTTISGNYASSYGGGIYNGSSGTLTVTDTTISENSAGDDGGGIYNNYGTLTVTNTTISENYADYGGGIYNNGTLTVTDTTISGNDADYGGGIYNNGTLTVTNTTISENSAGDDGGGIYNNYGTLTVTNTTISENSAGDDGGGISNSGTLTVTNTTISGNYAYDGGGISNNSGTLTVTNTTISGNSATFYGGGIYNDHGTLTVTNTTISGNSTNYFGGGISNSSGTLTVTNTTISGNSADYGGGIRNDGTATLYNTIVAKNSSDIDSYYSNTIFGFNNLTTFTGWNGTSSDNLGYNDNSALFIGEENGDYRLAANSQAINKGDNSYVSGITIDILGNSRIAGNNVDLGAYEYGALPPTPTNFNPSSVTPNSVTLTWDAVQYPYSYTLEYKKSADGSWTKWNDHVSSTGTTITGLDILTEYDFRLTATNASGTSGYATINNLETTELPSLPTPQNLRAVTAGQTTIALDWNDVDGATSYILERKIGSGNWEQIDNISESKYVDQNLTAGTNYSYRVQAVGSAFSGEISVTTLSETAEDVPVVLKSELNTETKTATLEWVDLGNDYTYFIFRNGALVAQSQTTAGYNDSNLPTTTRYLIYAYHQWSGEWTKSLPVVLSTAPVQAEIVSHEVVGNGIKLNWDIPNSTQFIIFRNGIPVSGVVSDQTWTDSSPLTTSNGNQYTLYVNYEDAQGFSYWTWSSPYVVQQPTTQSQSAINAFWADYDLNLVDDEILNAIV